MWVYQIQTYWKFLPESASMADLRADESVLGLWIEWHVLICSFSMKNDEINSTQPRKKLLERNNRQMPRIIVNKKLPFSSFLLFVFLLQLTSFFSFFYYSQEVIPLSLFLFTLSLCLHPALSLPRCTLFWPMKSRSTEKSTNENSQKSLKIIGPIREGWFIYKILNVASKTFFREKIF